jgi:hypothetical protein
LGTDQDENDSLDKGFQGRGELENGSGWCDGDRIRRSRPGRAGFRFLTGQEYAHQTNGISHGERKIKLGICDADAVLSVLYEMELVLVPRRCLKQRICFLRPVASGMGREEAGIFGMNVARPSGPLPSEDLRTLADEQLIQQIVAGNQDALAVLFDRYHRLVFDVAFRIVRDPGEAEEVVQTVFLDIYRAVANFDARKGIPKVWILQYAYHRALHRKRHRLEPRLPLGRSGGCCRGRCAPVLCWRLAGDGASGGADARKAQTASA